eukprot:1917736-Prymnesium_polylepis.1
MAAEAGAAKVYAVECDPASAEAARQQIGCLERAGSVTPGQVVVLEQFSTSLTLADVPGVEVVLHELMGTFASSEGVRKFITDTKKLSNGSLSIPHRAQTMLAPGVAPSLELLAR